MSDRADKPGKVHVGPVTVATRHKHPGVIEGFAGVIRKISQPLPIVDPTNQPLLDAAQTVAIGEEALVDLAGEQPVPTAALPVGGTAIGTPLWIDPADNTLHDAAAAGLLKFGKVSSVADEPWSGATYVNLSERGAF